VYELDDEANSSHNKESNTHCLADLNKFTSIRFCAPVDKLSSVSNEVFGDVQELLDLVGHGCDLMLRSKGAWKRWTGGNCEFAKAGAAGLSPLGANMRQAAEWGEVVSRTGRGLRAYVFRNALSQEHSSASASIRSTHLRQVDEPTFP